MSEENFKLYQRKTLAEMRPYVEGENLDHVQVFVADIENGSPKEGDMIGRNQENHENQWLVSKEYFEQNYEKLEVTK